MKRAALLVVLAACGDDREVHDPRATGECIATFAGNFAETSTSADNCPVVRPRARPDADTLLQFGISASALGEEILGIVIDLGVAPPPGRYTSATGAPWSAVAIRQVATGGCILSAGDTAVPPGAFALNLAELAAPGDVVHGTLVVEQYVLAIMGTDCGPGSTETVTVEF